MMSTTIRATIALAGIAALAAVTPANAKKPVSCVKPKAAYKPLSLGSQDPGKLPDQAELVLRFVQLSDAHIYDDDASPLFTGNQLEPVIQPTIDNTSAQRLQDELTDEVLNAMVKTINECNTADAPIELMIATGDNTDSFTLNEVRRFIDNLDGASGALSSDALVNNLGADADKAGTSQATTAYEANCGYTTVDSRGVAKLGGNAPCPAGLQDIFAIPTGKLVPDSEARRPSPNDPLDQFMPVRSPRQSVDTTVASALGLSLHIAPGLPQILRCEDPESIPGLDCSDPVTDPRCDCPNRRLSTPYYAVVGNHDGAIRGTVTMQQFAQGASMPYGRYLFESQREWLNEFFYTTPSPGPVGHGFNLVEGGRDNPLPANDPNDRWNDPDDRNDGYYAFDAGADGAVRMIVLNTLYDGVRSKIGPKGNVPDFPGMDFHQNGSTNESTGGLVTGNEITNPIGLEQGVLGADQFEWLRKELRTAAGQDPDTGDAIPGEEIKPVLIFSHHPDRSFTDQRLGFPADGGKTSVELDVLLGGFANVVAHFAGHTHENVIRPCAAGAGKCDIKESDPRMPEDFVGEYTQPEVANGFWRIETASLIDYPQEGRIVELFDLCTVPRNRDQNGCKLANGSRYVLRLTMISPDPDDDLARQSHALSIAEATCDLSDTIGGPASSVAGAMIGSFTAQDPQPFFDHLAARAEKLQELEDGDEAGVQLKFCQDGMSKEDILSMAAGKPEDRDVILFP